MSNEDGCKLFVAGLSDSITEQVLRELFEATGGSVADVSIPKDRATGRPRGFGFVTLGTQEQAQTALNSLDGSMQAGRSISVRPFRSDPPRRGPRDGPGSGPGGPPSGGGPPGSDRTLYLGNLPYDATQAEIETLFQGAGAGPITRIHLPMGPDGRPRGFAFVTMGSGEAALSAVTALAGGDLKGRKLVVNVAHPRGERPRGDRRGPPSGGGGGHGSAPGLDEPRRTFDEGRRSFDRGPADEPRKAAGGKRGKKKHKGQRRNEPSGGGNVRDWRKWDDD